MFSKESLESFSGDFANPDALLEHLTGKTYRQLQIVQARAAWGKGNLDIPYSLDEALAVEPDNIEPLLADINKVLKDKHGFTLSSIPYESKGDATRAKVAAAIMREKLQNVRPSLSADTVRDMARKFVAAHVVKEYFAIKAKVLQALEKRFPSKESFGFSTDDIVMNLTGSRIYDHKLLQARQVWTETTDPRLPLPADPLFAIADPYCWPATSPFYSGEAILGDINDAISAKYGIKLRNFPFYSIYVKEHVSVNELLTERGLRKLGATVSLEEAQQILEDFIEAQKVDRVERIKAEVRQCVIEALSS